MSVLALFTAHPATKDETYLQHGWFAARFGFTLIGCGLAALTHALLPFVFEFTASNKVRDMYGVLRERYHWD
jgi:hypothetical protein